MNCPNCGFENPDTHKFCGECGSPLKKKRDEAERRVLTVLFCDLAGSTALSVKLDPEDLRSVLSAYQDRCRTAIERYGGYIARYMGDGILVYFGYPTAHDDDAKRAVHAALDIAAAIPDIAIDSDVELSVRIGIATGDVVVGDIIGHGAAEEHAVLGVTPNLAARLQAVAQLGDVVVSDETSVRLGEAFQKTALGTMQLKGIDRLTQAWRIDGVAEPDGELGPTTPFVGRANALCRLRSAMKRARPGSLEIVHVIGSAGIGKSRLVEEFLLNESDIQRITWICSAFQDNVPLHPVSTDLTGLAETVPSTGEAARRVVFESVPKKLLERAATSPVVLHLEDGHWIDPTTAELLETFQDRLGDTAVLVIVASRPAVSAERLVSAMGGMRLDLGGLEPRDAEALVAAVAEWGIPEPTRKRIIDRAGGLPLFLEELTRVVKDGRTDEVPISLQESLLARLDSLGPAKRIAQLASVVGREFDVDDLLAISEIEESDVEPALTRMRDAGLLTMQGRRYSFRHALMRDAAYDTLLFSTRRRVHGELADRLVAINGAAEPERIAQHLAGAERYDEAVHYWCLAARRSSDLWAHVEAAAQYETALSHAEAVSDPVWELGARLDLVASLRILDRYSTALAELDQAEGLARRVGRDADWLKLHVLRGNILFPLGEAQKCIASHEAARELARQMEEPEAEARALSGVADALFADFRMVSAERAYDDCVSLADKHGLSAVTLANVSLRGHMRVYLCRLDDALTDCRRAVGMSLEAGNRRAEMTATGSCLGKALLEAGEFAAANKAFQDAAGIAVDLGAHRYEALNLLFQGKVVLDTSKSADAVDLGRRAVEIARRAGPRFCLPMALGVVARSEAAPAACREALHEAEALIAEGCLAHNHLWFYRDAGLAAIRHGWPGDARRYAQALRDAFSDETLPWCEVVSGGIEALEQIHPNQSR